MNTFVVERYLDGWNHQEVAALLARLEDLAASHALGEVRYLRSIVFDVDETCLSIFEGIDDNAVREANVRAGLPVHRVVAATMTPIAGAS